MTLIFVGFSLYTLALILRSHSFRHIRFTSFIDLSHLHRVPVHYRRRLSRVLFLAAAVVIVIGLAQTLDTDRSTFLMLAGLGALLVLVRFLAFFFDRIAFLGLEIEVDPTIKLSVRNVLRSVFVLGGLFLVTVGAVTPVVLDAALLWRFHAGQEHESRALTTWAESNHFHDRYQPRLLDVRGVAQNEQQFVASMLEGRRFVLLGRAGVGKSWFLAKVRFMFQENVSQRNVLVIEAKRLDPERSLLSSINSNHFGAFAWCSLPVTRRIVEHATILVDGLDEVPFGNRDRVLTHIVEFSRQFPTNVLLVTTRPLGLTQIDGFEVAELRGFDEQQSRIALAGRANNLAARLVGTAPVQRFVALLDPSAASGKALQPPQLAALYHAFLKRFGFDEVVTDSNGRQLPFLATYRDMDIVESLFKDALDGSLVLRIDSAESVRWQLYTHFLKRRIQFNYHLEPGDEQVADQALQQLVELCRVYVARQPPGIRTFRFRHNAFKKFFQDTTFDKFVLESELLVMHGDRLQFDNPLLDRYFLLRVSRPQMFPAYTTYNNTVRK